MKLPRVLYAGVSFALAFSGGGVAPVHAHDADNHEPLIKNNITLDKVPGVRYDLKLYVRGNKVVDDTGKVVGGPLRLEYKIWASTGLVHQIKAPNLECAAGADVNLKVDPGQYAYIEYKLSQFQGVYNGNEKVYTPIAGDKVGVDLTGHTGPAQGEYIEFEFCAVPNE